MSAPEYVETTSETAVRALIDFHEKQGLSYTVQEIPGENGRVVYRVRPRSIAPAASPAVGPAPTTKAAGLVASRKMPHSRQASAETALSEGSKRSLRPAAIPERAAPAVVAFMGWEDARTQPPHTPTIPSKMRQVASSETIKPRAPGHATADARMFDVLEGCDPQDRRFLVWERRSTQPDLPTPQMMQSPQLAHAPHAPPHAPHSHTRRPTVSSTTTSSHSSVASTSNMTNTTMTSTKSEPEALPDKYEPGFYRTHVFAMTIERLVAQMTSRNDQELLSTFFLTYRMFMAPPELLALLLARFDWAMTPDKDESDLRRIAAVRTFLALRYWLLNYFLYDFYPDKALRQTLTDWVNAKSHSGYIRSNSKHLKLIRGLKKVIRKIKESHVMIAKEDIVSGDSEDSHVDFSLDSDEYMRRRAPVMPALKPQSVRSLPTVSQREISTFPIHHSQNTLTRGLAASMNKLRRAATRPIKPDEPLPAVVSHTLATQTVVHKKSSAVSLHEAFSKLVKHVMQEPSAADEKQQAGVSAEKPHSVAVREGADPVSPSERDDTTSTTENGIPTPVAETAVEPVATAEEVGLSTPGDERSGPRVLKDLYIDTQVAQAAASERKCETAVSSPADWVDALWSPEGLKYHVSPKESDFLEDTDREDPPGILAPGQFGQLVSAKSPSADLSNFLFNTSGATSDLPLIRIELDDVDLSDEDDDVVEAKRTWRKLPQPSFFGGSGSQGNSQRGSIISLLDDHPLPPGVEVVPNFVLEGIESDSDEGSEAGGVSAALRRLEGIVDPVKEAKKQQKVRLQMEKSERLDRFNKMKAQLMQDTANEMGMDVTELGIGYDIVLNGAGEGVSYTMLDNTSSVLGEDDTTPVPASAIVEKPPTTDQDNAPLVTLVKRPSTAPSTSNNAPGTVRRMRGNSNAPSDSPNGKKANGVISNTPSPGRKQARSSILPFKRPHYVSFIASIRTQNLAQHLCLIERDLLRLVSWQDVVCFSDVSELCLDTVVLDWETHLKEQRKLHVLQKADNELESTSELYSPIANILAHFSLMSSWICSEIVQTDSMEERARLIAKLIRVAFKSFRISNFATCAQIVCGLGLEPVARLRKTWARVPKWEVRTLASLRLFVTRDTSPSSPDSERYHSNSTSADFSHLRTAMMAIYELYGPPGQSPLGTDTGVNTIFSMGTVGPQVANAMNGKEITGCIPLMALFIDDLIANTQQPTLIDPSSLRSVAVMDNDGFVAKLDRPGIFAEYLNPRDSSQMLLKPFININKLQQRAHIVQQIIAFQEIAEAYNYTPDVSLYVKCMKLKALPLDAALDISMALE